MTVKHYLLCASIVVALSAQSKSISIEDAIKKGIISATITSKGGYLGDVVEMKIKNNTTNSIELKIEAGRRLDMPDSLKQQDILITKEENILLAANAQKTIDVFGMCCQANNGSPFKGNKFSIGKMADSALIKIAQFINYYKLWKSDVAQHAVWSISDGKSVAGITHSKDTSIVNQKLLNYVCKLLNLKVPEYKITYKPSDGTAFSFDALSAEGRMEYYCSTNSQVSFGFYDAKGNMIIPYFVDKYHNPGQYGFSWWFNIEGLPKGKYEVRLRIDAQIVKVIKVEF